MKIDNPTFNFSEEYALEVDTTCRQLALEEYHKMIDKYLPALKRYSETKETGRSGFEKLHQNFVDYFKIATIFYSIFDEKLNSKIEKYIQGGNIVPFETNDMRGENKVVLEDDKSVKIYLAPQDSMMGYLSIVQTLAYSLSQKYQKGKRPNLDYLYRIEGIFVQKIFIDCLRDSGLVTNVGYQSLCGKLNSSFEKNVNILLEERELFKELKTPIRAQDLLNYALSHEDDPDLKQKMARLEKLRGVSADFPSNNGRHAFKCVLGTVVADVLYDDYKQDKKKTMKRFRKYLNHSSDFERIEDVFGVLLGKDYAKKLNDKVLSGGKDWDQERSF